MKTIIAFSLFLIISSVAIYGQGLPETYPAYYFTFKEADSSDYPSIYIDQNARDSVAAGIGNAHKRAIAISNYAWNDQKVYPFLKQLPWDQKWALTLTDGEEIQFGPPKRLGIVEYNFEHYYPDIELFVFRAQWNEGNDYFLISRKTGQKIRAIGPPVFSPSKELFIAFRGTDFTSYNWNGIQLFGIENGQIKKYLDYETDLAPTKVKWIDNRHFRMETFKMHTDPSGILRIYQHFQVEISPTK